MPLFFFVSGFLRFQQSTQSYKFFLLKKVKTVLLPYILFWFTSVILFGNLYSKIMIDQWYPFGIDQITGLILGGRWLATYSNNFPLWFLQTFFIAIILFELFIKYFNKIFNFIFFLVIFFMSIPFQDLFQERPAFHIDVLPVALIFLYLGYFTKYVIENYKIMDEIMNSGTIAVLFFVIGFKVSMYHAGNISQINSYAYIPGGFLTILALYILSRYFSKFSFIRYVGISSLSIMAIHSLTYWIVQPLYLYLMQNIGINNKFIHNILIVVITICVCLGIKEIFLFAYKKIKLPSIMKI